MTHDYCPFCGGKKEEDGSCKSCGAKEYVLWGISLGYIHSAEYHRMEGIIKAAFLLLGLLLLLGISEMVYYEKILASLSHLEG